MNWKDLKKRKLDGLELVIAIAQDSKTKNVAMVAFQNEEAYNKTQETGKLYFYSTSKKKLWKKGEVSGNVMIVKETRIDCDTDSLLYLVDLKGGACHEGYDTCFYKTLNGKIIGKKLFDPEKVY